MTTNSSDVDTLPGGQPPAETPPFAHTAAGPASDPTAGLTSAEAAARLARFGPNQITAEKPPSVLRVALSQERDPTNIMLIAVTVVSFAIGQVCTGVIVALLILLNVVLGPGRN